MIRKKIMIVLSLAFISVSTLNAATLPSGEEFSSQISEPALELTLTNTTSTVLAISDITPIDSIQTRLYYGALGAAQLATGCAIVGSIGLSAYTLSCAVAATYSWLYTPAGTTACIGYVAETEGVPFVMPLVYGLAIHAPQVSTQAVIQAGSVFAKAEGLRIVGYTSALATPAVKATQYITSAVSASFYNGWSNLKRAFA
jgi:hypothetical protein